MVQFQLLRWKNRKHCSPPYPFTYDLVPPYPFYLLPITHYSLLNTFHFPRITHPILTFLAHYNALTRISSNSCSVKMIGLPFMLLERKAFPTTSGNCPFSSPKSRRGRILNFSQRSITQSTPSIIVADSRPVRILLIS
jgi:hypothetical protein